jgi:hypothetical protein
VLTPNTLLAFCRVNAMHLVDKLRLAYEYAYRTRSSVLLGGKVFACPRPCICSEHWLGQVCQKAGALAGQGWGLNALGSVLADPAQKGG